MKILFAPDTGKLLGAQAVGHDGVDKRIDVLATALKAGMTVHDLAEFELAYAPPFGSAKDPVNLAGMAAQNVLAGDVQLAQWNEVASLDPTHTCCSMSAAPTNVRKGSFPARSIFRSMSSRPHERTAARSRNRRALPERTAFVFRRADSEAARFSRAQPDGFVSHLASDPTAMTYQATTIPNHAIAS